MAKTLPVMLLKDFVLLPNQEVKVELNHSLSLMTLELSEKEYDGELILVSPKDVLEEVPDVDDLPGIAVVGKIVHKITLPNGHVRVTIEGIKRVKISKYLNSKKQIEVLECQFLIMQTPDVEMTDEIALQRELKKLFRKYIKANPNYSNSALQAMQNYTTLNDLTDFIAGLLPTTKENKIYYISELNPLQRASKLLQDLTIELKVIQLDQKINQALQEEMDKSQKEFVLKERIKEIQKELGEENKKQAEVDIYKEKLEGLDLLYSTKVKVAAEIKKYEYMSDMSPEVTFVRNYLDLFFSLPWNEETIETEDLKAIEKDLNKTHYGLDKVKTRVLEYVAMKKRNPLLQAPILCLVGPPGVGKSTIASSIAHALHRKFYKISVGGLNDSSELIGNRRSYIGSAPGKIIQALQKSGSKNPLILIDEVDKMVKDYKGDPASTLLDILDANLNQNFMDSYLEEPFDLSHVLFILTANYEDKIPSELKDRLEIIELSSYTIFEKVKLAREYLIPRLENDYHVSADEVFLSDEAIKHLVLDYTDEPGVRDLQRHLASLYRKVILNSVKSKKNLALQIESKDLKKYLEEKTAFGENKPKILTSGLVNGLAVTNSGGRVLSIESLLYEGKGKVTVTGLLGDVMKESLAVVGSYLKRHASDFEINENYFKTKDVHIHFLSGSVPKNGPSAGVAITTALISLLTNKIVPNDIAMTGEMSLRGEILPVGGIKEKVIGAYNYGMKKVFLPAANKLEAKEIPKEIKENIEIIYVKDYKEIYEQVFLGKK